MSEESSPNPLAGAKSRTEALTLSVAIIAVIGMAVFGWMKTAEEHHMALGALDLIEDVQETLFGKDYILISSKPEESHWAVTAATWLAKMILAYAVIRGVAVLFGRRLRQWWFEKMSNTTGHTVVCGLGRRGSVLANKLLDRGTKVVVVEMDEKNPELEPLARKGVHIVTGNALDEFVLQQARADHAGRVISLLPDDEKNAAVASEVDRMGHAEIIAGVESYALRSIFRKIPRVRLVAFQARAARRILHDLACQTSTNPEIRKRGASLLIQASNPLRDELIRAAAVFLQISGDTVPTLILPNTTDKDRRNFEARYPDAFRILNLKWHDGPIDEMVGQGGLERPDLAIFSLDNDITSLDAAEQFRVRIGTKSCSKETIVTCISDTGELLKLAKENGEFAVYNQFELSLGDSDPLDDSAEKAAQTLHEAYCQENPGQLPPWRELPEMVKDSNRLAASHNSVKRAIWKSCREESDDALIDHLARCEHLRWMGEKIMDGWRWSGSPDKTSRDNSRLLHHLFIPYDQLTQEEKDKDVTVVKKSLNIT